jgi:hypothetical protein
MQDSNTIHYGVLSYPSKNGYFNLGDYIQSLAAMQYLPRIDSYIPRDKLNSKIEEKTIVIMNGWFTHNPENWPPNDNILPLFVSFHLNSHVAEVLLSKKQNVEYLKKYSPIGCRDINTVNFLKEKGIDAYYSSCLTTTLDFKYKSKKRTEDIYIVDVLYKNDYKSLYRRSPVRIIPHILKGKFSRRNERDKIIKDLIPQSLLEKATYLTNSYRSKDYTSEERFTLAEEMVKKFATAKLIITSRIHCALPCLAFGTPVIFVAGGDLNHPNEMSRLKGIIEHMNILSTDNIDLDPSIAKSLTVLNSENIDWNNITNPSSYKSFSDELKVKCISFISE